MPDFNNLKSRQRAYARTMAETVLANHREALAAFRQEQEDKRNRPKRFVPNSPATVSLADEVIRLSDCMMELEATLGLENSDRFTYGTGQSLGACERCGAFGTVTYAYSDTPECYNGPCFTFAARERQEAGQQAD